MGYSSAQHALHLVIGLLTGLFAHHRVFIYGEWHKSAPGIAIFHALLVAFILISMCCARSNETTQALLAIQTISGGYFAALMTSIILYRVLFHRLTRQGFKGPWYARITKLWHLWAVRDAKNHLLLADLHQKYGDFVRTGPAELTVFHPDVFLAIDGPGTECIKGEWYDILYPSMQSIVTCRDKEAHAVRRRQWNRAFYPDALTQYNARFLKHIDLLDEYVESTCRANVPCEMRDLLIWFGFDAMGDIIFDTSFDMLRSRKWHPIVQHVKKGLHLIGLLSSTPWLTHIGFRLAPRIGIVNRWYELVDYCKKQIQRRKREGGDHSASDFMHFMLSQEDKVGDGPSWLEGDTLFFIVAGSEPLGNTLLFILYNLVKNPHHIELIYHEIAELDINDDTSLGHATHLNAVINESSRLCPTVLTAGARKTGAKGVTIGNTYIPPHTTIVAPRYSIFRREDCFERADEFVPERWSSRPEMIRNSAAFVPFGIGKYSCLGRGLSLHILRRVTARLVKKYKFQLAPGETGEHVYKDLMDHISSTPGKLNLYFKLRRYGNE
ncbi:cytochrome P450 [Hypoxylon sp. FL1857]|nr:cytochrome P450 [Hypoxylon sp. FL1857]